MAELDRTQLEILAALAEDPRVTIVSLAERLHLSRNTIQARLAQLRESGVLLSYERSFSPDALGFPLQAFLTLTLRQPDANRAVAELARIPEILQAHRVSGPADLVVRVACRDARHLFDVDARVRAIDGVERSETALSMGEAIPFRAAGLIGLARREA